MRPDASSILLREAVSTRLVAATRVLRPRVSSLPILVTLAMVVSACATRSDGPPRGSVHKPGIPGDAIPRKEARSRFGNPPVYEVHGKRYVVMNSSYGYQERGVASWYGKKFHGRLTSSQEPYDMYGMTAAHKTLPLPTYVRVRNLRNNRSVVVRVNDRGPFIANRIIDLSYSAAQKLGMIRDGTSLVEVTALSFDEPPPRAVDVPTRASSPAPPADVPATPQREPQHPKDHEVYVQVGAFGDVDNARRRYRLIKNNGIADAFVHKDESQSPTLYRIRIGPIGSIDSYDQLVIRLGSIGITDSHLVTE